MYNPSDREIDRRKKLADNERTPLEDGRKLAVETAIRLLGQLHAVDKATRSAWGDYATIGKPVFDVYYKRVQAIVYGAAFDDARRTIPVAELAIAARKHAEDVAGELEPPDNIFGYALSIDRLKGIADDGRARYAYGQLQEAIKGIQGIPVLREEKVQTKCLQLSVHFGFPWGSGENIQGADNAQPLG